MVRLIWSVICSRAILDKETNQVSLIDVLDQIRVWVHKDVEGEIIELPKTFDWVSLWTRTHSRKPGRCKSRFLILNNNAKIIYQQEFEIDLTKRRFAKTRMPVDDLLVQQSGEHHFIIQVRLTTKDKWHDVFDMPVNVTINRE